MQDSPIVLTVSQLTQAIKLNLETQFPRVEVKGEISNFKKQSSNHLYFTLKDSQSQIQCAMFSNEAKFLKELPKDGDQVHIKGELNVYAPRGNYQIIVRSLQKAGIGALLTLLYERKEKFLKLGWFDAIHKKKLPPFPKTIGVVTSPTGAVILDILQILKRRAHGFHVLLNPVKVQGEGSALEIAKAIHDFNRYKLADVLIVGRGGGSLEDLWAFNEEVVVESIYKSEIPIITAIGHETDTTLADLAADLRAPTPSAAAELVLAEKEVHQTFLDNCKSGLIQVMNHTLKLKKRELEAVLRQPLMQSPLNMLRLYQQKVDEVQFLVDQSIERTLSFYKEQVHQKNFKLQELNPKTQIQKKIFNLEQLKQKIDFSFKIRLSDKKNSLEKLFTHMTAIDPKNILKKGYSIVFDEKSHSAIFSVKDIALKQKIKLILKDGSLEAIVDNIVPKS